MNGKTAEASSQLTEFAPLSPEASQPGVGFLFSKFFKFNRSAPEAEFPSPTPSSISPDLNVQADWQSTENMDAVNTDAGDLVASFPVDVEQGRSLPNVLKRISSLLALKSTGLQSYKDTDFKQYWMPDSVSKECYDCGEKFTTFRRRHHCRICGQIFCSRCCNQEITGKIMGCTGDLRVCTYCCKVVLSYLQSADMSADLRALQEDLQTKFGHVSTPSSMIQSSAGSTVGNLADTQECVPSTGRRKPSIGFQEDKFALGRAQESHCMSIEERCRALQKSASLRALYEDICRPNTGLTLLNHRYRLRNYPGCFLGSELNDWLVAQSHAATRIQATAIGQALLEAGYIENISEQSFIDGYALYKPKQVLPSEQFVGPGTPDEERSRNSHDPQEPYWVKQITQQESTTTDSESECHISEHEEILSLPSSGSTFYLDLNIAENTVHLSRPLTAKQEQQNTDNEPGGDPKHTLVIQNQAQDVSRNHGLSKEFLSGALLLPSGNIRDVVPESGWHKVKQLRSDNGELDAFTRLSAAFKQHEQNMLKQLLNAEGLSQSWMDIMIPLVENIVDAVRPDVHNDADDMDIRQYVQFKKVPGGSRNESCIVNGVVCTKNVAHRAMATELKNPRILLLGCSIVYQRIEGRLLSLEPVMMQEHEYLRHVVARIANLQPDLVLVHRNVSRLAQEFLLALKVTLVLNVKASVLDRIARCTQTNIISTVDAHIGRPQLGTCQTFYLKTFHNEKGPSKTLMFFEGCSSQHLGCTVILRGAANSELAKLKRVASRLVFIHYSWRLEKSYLMDEFARPPSPPADTFFEENTSNDSPQDESRVSSEQCLEINISEPIKGESFKVKEIENELTSNNQSTVNVKQEEIKTHNISEKHSNSLEGTDVVRTLDTKEVQNEMDRTKDTEEKQEEKLCKCSFDNGSSIDRKSSPHIYCVQRHSTGNVEDNIDKSENNRVLKSEMNEWKSMNEIIRIESKEKSVSEEKRMNVESVSDFSDPLRNFVYLSQDDEVFVPSSQSSGSAQCLSVAELPLTNRFRKALDDTILSSSPFLKFTVPYLETEAGRNCALRKYFPDEIFWSIQFDQLGAPNPTGSTRTVSSMDGVDSVLQDSDLRLKGLKMQLRPQHAFVSAKLTSPADSNEVQTLLAHFRACGGRLVPSTALNDMNKLNRPPTRGNSTTVESTSSATSGAVKQGAWCDALDPANHQKLSVLFCSYSHESQNAPAFCVNPWVVHMDFYGHNDIPLGTFLERYCFRSSYACPSENCSTPMLKHVRRFVHDMGCIQIMLKDLDEPISEAEENHILMWNRCSKCKMVSPVVPMSADTWALSFAKFLELRFHGGMYRRRGQEGSVCAHSLHYDHCQFFAMKNIVAYFEYTSISQWEISLPPPLITTYYDPQQQANVIEEIKMLALKGYEVYTSIQEKLCTFEAEMEVIVSLKQQLQKEQAYFKSCIEEIQLKLTSPTLEAKKLEGQMAERDVQMLMWRIEDSVVNLKRLISEIVTSWNARIQDLLLLSKRRDEKHKKGEGGKPSAPTASFSLEYDRMSSGSLHASDDVVEVVPSSITTQWEDTSSCSEGREDTSPSSPEPALMIPGAKAVLDCQEMTEGEDNLSLEAAPLMDTEAQTLNTVVEPTLLSHTDALKNTEDLIEAVNRPLISGSPRGHVRSYSDVTPSLGDEGSDTKHIQTSDKKSVKTILSQLLPSSSAMAPIQSPLSCQEHHLSAAGCSVPVVVYENEPSSIIAYALSSPDYRRSLDEICAKKYASSDQATPSPVHKRKTGVTQVEKEVSGSTDSVQSCEAKRSGVLSFLRGSSSANNTGRTKILDGVQYSTGSAPSNGNDTSASEVDEPSVSSNKTDSKSSRASASNIEVQFSDGTCNFYCRVYFGEQFANLREIVLPSGEEGFIRSLSRCVQWAARGGKSGSNFCKTKDDRFVLKEMSKIEMQIFLDFAPNYFGYVQRCLFSKQPTLLGKIVGVYRIVYRNLTSNATLRSNLLVMENLFYSRYVTHKFDLKGSERNRLVNPVTADRDGEIVLLDENLLRRTCDDPLYILPHSKTVLTQAINNDTQFLASQSVMDYSLLVGLDKKRRELVVGIIDYIRTFTWDKKLETMVKSTGFLGGQGKQPTIVSPELYRARFIAAMHRYFLPVPDRWTGLGKGLDC